MSGAEGVVEAIKPYTCKHGCERDLIIDVFASEAKARIEAQAARIAQLETALVGAREALKSSAHRLNAAAVTMTADGKDLAADKFTEWANEAYNLAGDPE